MILFIKPISLDDIKSLEDVYKEVFSGFPWYEDFACKKCKSLYTNKTIQEESKERVFKLGNLENCLKCNFPLELVSYYPEIIDQRKLIREACIMQGFVGYLALRENRAMGFSWGFSVPSTRTESVNFPEVIPKLTSLKIMPCQAFYGAETGIIEADQGKGLGKLLVSQRTLKAFQMGYRTFVNRTINPRMRKILGDLFSRKEPRLLFKDPETGSQWFSWDFQDFNLELAEQITRGVK